MDSCTDIYRKICRVCLEYGKSGNMVPLFDGNGLSCYGEAISTFSNVSIQSGDNWPTMMCENCLHLLKQAIQFKFKCEWTEKRLQNMTKAIEVSSRNIVERVVEYTLFAHYFPQMNLEDPSKRFLYDTSQEKCFKFDEKSLDDCSFDNNDFTSLSSDLNNETPMEFERNDDEQSADIILDKLEKVLVNDCNVFNKHMNKMPISMGRIYKRIRKLKSRTKYEYVEPPKPRDLICKVCGKVLANENTYEHHMQRHTGFRFICEHCAKGFPVRAELQNHLLVRHGIGPYLQCSHCSFKAPRKFELTEHERLHTGERPYTCEKCGLTFRRRYIWKKHLLLHSEKTVQCPLCPLKFFQKAHMLAHKNNIHERLYMFLCSQCGATYTKPNTVRRHLVERHGIPKSMQGKITRIMKGKEPRHQDENV